MLNMSQSLGLVHRAPRNGYLRYLAMFTQQCTMSSLKRSFMVMGILCYNIVCDNPDGYPFTARKQRMNFIRLGTMIRNWEVFT